MKNGFSQMARSKAIVACAAVALALVHNGALGEEISPDSLRLRAGVVKAEGYETPPAKGYIVANSTDVFSGHALYGTDVTGQLKLGEKAEVLAKVKGWDWMLVGKEGTGIGYVPTSMLAPEDKYVAPMRSLP
jgi:hypothetical protein